MSTLKLDTLSNKAGTASVPSDTIVSGTAKAWVHFNGTGTVAIRRSFNVSSITDNGTGNYTVNFTVAMSDASFAFTGSAGEFSIAGVDNGLTIPVQNTTSSVQFFTRNVEATGAALRDYNSISVAIFS